MPDPTSAISLEGGTLESQPIAEPLPQEPGQVEVDTEPDGVVEHQGRRLIDVSVLTTERKRVREATEKAIREKELAPLQQKADEADRLRQALSEAQPYLDHLRQHPELLQPQKPTPLEEQVSDDEAGQEARDLELYDSRTGQPDLPRAKRIIARRRQDALAAARAATTAAIGPITSQTAAQASRQNFVSAAMRRDANDQPLVDPKALAELWAQLPADLTQHPEVADVLIDAAIGRSVRAGGARPTRAERGPIVSEPAGGLSGSVYQMDKMAQDLAKHAGITQKQFTEAAKTYRPGELNVIGD